MGHGSGELAARFLLLFVKQAGILLKAPGKSIPSNFMDALLFQGLREVTGVCFPLSRVEF
jgi:hypothetical protein